MSINIAKLNEKTVRLINKMRRRNPMLKHVDDVYINPKN